MAYIPRQGDIIYLDFNPQAGHEQAGRRPALVISNESFYKYTKLAVVCPITNTDKAFPLHVPLDDRTSTTGVILCEHIKSLDLNARKASFKEQLPADLLEEVLERIQLFF
ncbi:transcriptional modulator of MazE/toxin, MazF [Carboxydothermus islandicus]|uniref:Transcriptional modulator of MazE/toxin, MazF n=1 Tax=Carboxydothermus islandicus TaxID=661089 RepID=A0A1L8D2L3_9THEO|nr:type II toxin-antitoxin system PemK/MazF family toxin [Carboxydothermus islandicus]GAV25393.1 transcriptional modulator of MazE/toxin, MazF [Carboxydothermus islandicus]